MIPLDRRSGIVALAVVVATLLSIQLYSGEPAPIRVELPTEAQISCSPTTPQQKTNVTVPATGAEPPRPNFVSKENIAQKYAFLRDFEATHLLTVNNFSQPPLAHACVSDADADLHWLQPFPSIRVVYYISFMKDRFWATKFIVEHQLVELALIGLADNAELYLVVSTPDPHNIRWLKELVKRLGLPRVHYAFLETNLWEFPGVHLLWELACREDDPDAIYFYLHSKGVSRMVQGKRWRDEVVVFHEAVVPWRAIVRLFMQSPIKINTIGLAASPQGYQWFNVWWARGDYLMKMTEPGIVLSYRYYYEEYLSYVFPAEMTQQASAHPSDKNYTVGPHCLAARSAFGGIDSPMLLQSTYNYNASTPRVELEATRGPAEGHYSLSTCKLEPVNKASASSIIFQRCNLVKDVTVCHVDSKELPAGQ